MPTGPIAPAGQRLHARVRSRSTAAWIRQAICYFDRYARRDGQWLFVTRDHQLFYGVDHDERPNHLPPANWPASDAGRGTLPFAWPTWSQRDEG